MQGVVAEKMRLLREAKEKEVAEKEAAEAAYLAEQARIANELLVERQRKLDEASYEAHWSRQREAAQARVNMRRVMDVSVVP